MNNTIDTQSLMLQMRSLAAQASSKPVSSIGEMNAAKSVDSPSNFADLLSKSINSVAEEGNKSGSMKGAFERGEDVELSDVMLQVQKASLSFQAMTQVRNKLLEAYKDVTRMPI